MRIKLQFTALFLLVPIFILTASKPEYGTNSEIEFNNASYDGVIEGLVLVDADTDEDVYQLREGLTIDYNEIKDRKLSVRLKPYPWATIELIERVDFKLEGAESTMRSEFVAPYSLFGDVNGDYVGRALPHGNYTIWVGVDDDADNSHYWDTRTIHFSVGEVVHSIAAFHMVRADKDEIAWEIEEGISIDYSNNPISFEARPGTFKVGSVALNLSGPVSYSAIENVEPFTLFGDSNGNFNGEILPEGDYTLTAIPYSEKNEMGTEGVSLTLHFSIHFNRHYFSLSSNMVMVDAASGDTLETFSVFKKKIIDKKDIQTDNVNFVVSPNTGSIASVYMALQGPVDSFQEFIAPSHTQTENSPPYSMFGDLDGVFEGRSLGTGMYRLYATPYAGADGTGNGGAGRVFEFELIDTSVAYTTESLMKENDFLLLYPNPSSSQVTLKASGERIQKIVILDIFGKQVREYKNPMTSEQVLLLDGLPKGMYVVQSITSKRTTTKKLVVQ